MSAALDLFAGAFVDGITPDPDLWLDEWADRFRILSAKASAEPGQWVTDKVPYMREPMRALSPQSPFHRVIIQGGAQIAKTEIGLCWLGGIIHYWPAPVLMVEPTVQVARRVSKQRIAPMIEATPEIRERVSPSRSRDSGNTTFEKEFAGDGMLILTGANSAAGLRSMPIRFLFLDEVDEYPGDVEGQGDPVALAEKRMQTFLGRRKSFLVSTPTIKGISRIETAYLASDRRRIFIRCPFTRCGHWDFLRWRDTNDGPRNIVWDENKPETAGFLCINCDKKTPESVKEELIAGHQWRPTAIGPPGVAGFHIPAFYSPWKSWSESAAEFLEVKEDVFKLKTWVNTVAAETWEGRGDSVEPSELEKRRELYPAEVPHRVGVLVASVDVQGDRLEVVVKGYGAGEESWLIHYRQIMGDPERPQVWRALDEFLATRFKHESGRGVRISGVAVDCNYLADVVYRYVKARADKRFFAVRGGREAGRPIIYRQTIEKAYRCRVFTLCTDTAKEIIYARLRIPKSKDPDESRPGYCHLPEGIATEDYLLSLTAEKLIRRYKRGKGPVRVWHQLRERNEGLDLEVYSLACLYILETLSGRALIRSLALRAKKLSRPVKAADPARDNLKKLEAALEAAAATAPAPSPAPEDPKPRRRTFARRRWNPGLGRRWKP